MSLSQPHMRPSDLLGLALSALAQQKVRTALTMMGVAIGTFALVASIAVGQGVDQAILGLFRGTDALRQVALYPKYEAEPDESPEQEAVAGTMSEAKRARLRVALDRKGDRRNPIRIKTLINQVELDRLARIAHVERVVPVVNQGGTASLIGLAKDEDIMFTSADPDGDYAKRLIAGRALSSDTSREAIVHEYLLYKAGLVGDDDIRKAIGREVHIEFRMTRGGSLSLARLLTFGEQGFAPEESEALIRSLRRLAPVVKFLPIPAKERAAFAKLLGRTPAEPEVVAEDRYRETFTIVGVMRDPLEGEEKRSNMFFGGASNGSDILLPPRTAADFVLRSPMLAENGIHNVVLTVDRDENVKAVTKIVESKGFSQSSLVQVLETIRMNVLLITLATAFIAAVALTVAAIGITNTMIMSVLERTHEIGIMKALGARTGQVRVIFLVEGAFIGLLGGVLGQLLAWLVSFPGDKLARSIMQAQSPRPVTDSLFAFPLWLVLGAPALAALITVMAAVYPAHRAAKVDPITSLRHE